MVESGGLENRCTARYRGFESYLLRLLPDWSPLASASKGFHSVIAGAFGQFTPEDEPKTTGMSIVNARHAVGLLISNRGHGPIVILSTEDTS